MKKRISRFMVFCLAVVMVLTSCTGGIERDKTTDVRFLVGDEILTKALHPYAAELNPDDYYWTITAVKKDGFFKTGECVDKIVNPGSDGKSLKGLTSVGPFSLGKWEFTLKANRSIDYSTGIPMELSYIGTVEGVVASGNNNIVVPMDNPIIPEANGNICVKKHMPVINKDGIDVSDGNTVDVVIKTLTGEDITPKKRTTSYKGEDYSKYSVHNGEYEVEVSYENWHNNHEICAKDTIIVKVYPNVNLYIGGSIDEITGQITIEPELMAKTAETTKSVVDVTQPLKLEVATVPESGSDALPEQQNTTLDIPANVLEEGEVKATVTTYSSKAVQSRDFNVSEGSIAIGGLDINLQQGYKMYKDDFVEEPLVVTTYIEKGLDPTRITVKYNGVAAQPTYTSAAYPAADGTGYDAATGKIVFKTTHLSSFYVEKNGLAVMNVDSNMAYDTIQEALTAVSSEKMETLKLLKDITVDESLQVPEHVAIDLNGKTLTAGSSLKTMFTLSNNRNLFIRDNSSNGIINSNKAELCYMPRWNELHIEGGTINAAAKFTENLNLAITTSVFIEGGTINYSGKEPMIVNAKDGTYMNVHISGGTINVTDDASCVFQNQGECTTSKDQLIVSGNPVINGTLAYIPAQCDVAISGGTFKANHTILYVRNGNLKISGGTFTAASGDALWKYNGSGCCKNGVPVVVEACMHGGIGNPSVSVTGGTFTGNGECVGIAFIENSGNEITYTVPVSGITGTTGKYSVPSHNDTLQLTEANAVKPI